MPVETGHAINALGAVVTGVVAVIFAFAKFTEGAWVTVILVPTLVFIFFRIHHHDKTMKEGLALEDAEIDGYMESPVRRIRLMAGERAQVSAGASGTRPR